MKAFDAVKYAAGLLKRAAIEDAHFEARLLVEKAVGFSPQAHPDCELDSEAELRLDALVKRRVSHEPLQYVLGEWEFMALPFYVSPAALIPRPETELLCMYAVDRIRLRGMKRVLDLCCGTGCIGVSLAVHTGASCDFSDISSEALELARLNAARHGVQGRFLLGDLFEPVSDSYDLIIANPPYLDYVDMAKLQPELRFEPSLALYGGGDGLDVFRGIAAHYKEHLAPNGALLMEIGYKQARAITGLFEGCVIDTDYSGQPRIAIVEDIC